MSEDNAASGGFETSFRNTGGDENVPDNISGGGSTLNLSEIRIHRDVNTFQGHYSKYTLTFNERETEEEYVKHRELRTGAFLGKAAYLMVAVFCSFAATTITAIRSPYELPNQKKILRFAVYVFCAIQVCLVVSSGILLLIRRSCIRRKKECSWIAPVFVLLGVFSALAYFLSFMLTHAFMGMTTIGMHTTSLMIYAFFERLRFKYRVLLYLSIAVVITALQVGFVFVNAMDKSVPMQNIFFVVEIAVLLVMAYFDERADRRLFLVSSHSRQKRKDILFKKRQAEELESNLIPLASSRSVVRKMSTDYVDVHVRCIIGQMDIVDFSVFCETTRPSEVITVLHKFFTRLDYLVGKYRIAKVKNQGDAFIYFNILDLDETVTDGVEAFLQLTMQMMQDCKKVAKRARVSLQWRAGVTMGSCIVSVMKTAITRFDVFGVGPFRANAMEQTSASDKIHVCKAVKEYVVESDEFSFTPNTNKVEIGGAVEQTFFLQGQLPGQLVEQTGTEEELNESDYLDSGSEFSDSFRKDSTLSIGSRSTQSRFTSVFRPKSCNILQTLSNAGKHISSIYALLSAAKDVYAPMKIETRRRRTASTGDLDRRAAMDDDRARVIARKNMTKEKYFNFILNFLGYYTESSTPYYIALTVIYLLIELCLPAMLLLAKREEYLASIGKPIVYWVVLGCLLLFNLLCGLAFFLMTLLSSSKRKDGKKRRRKEPVGVTIVMFVLPLLQFVAFVGFTEFFQFFDILTEQNTFAHDYFELLVFFINFALVFIIPSMPFVEVCVPMAGAVVLFDMVPYTREARDLSMNLLVFAAALMCFFSYFTQGSQERLKHIKFFKISQLNDRATLGIAKQEKINLIILKSIVPAYIAKQLMRAFKRKEYGSDTGLFFPTNCSIAFIKVMNVREMLQEAQGVTSARQVLRLLKQVVIAIERLSGIGRIKSLSGVKSIKQDCDLHIVTSTIKDEETMAEFFNFLAFLNSVQKEVLTLKQMMGNGKKLATKIGVARGSILAGVIGKKNVTFDVWGSTCNKASRMSGVCLENQITIAWDKETELAYGDHMDEWCRRRKVHMEFTENVKVKGFEAMKTLQISDQKIIERVESESFETMEETTEIVEKKSETEEVIEIESESEE